MKKILSGRQIVKAFGEGDEKRRVLDGVSVDISQGEFVSVMGPSGSGKSTLLYALSGMDTIDSGEVSFNGTELSGLAEKRLADLRRTDMGFIFQQATLLKNLNILDNIILPSVRDNRKKTRQLSEKAKALMERTGIGELQNRTISQASGGQLQRAGICRALMNDPKVIFGDEPTGALNSTSANEIMALLSDIHRTGVTVLLVTHDVKVAARAERVLYLLDGKIAGEYEPSQYTGSMADLDVREKQLRDWLAGMKF